MQIYVVQKGDTLSGISQTYDVTPGQLAAANELPDPNSLVVGQALVIPTRGFLHQVAPGETLDQISERFQVPVQQIIEMNQLTNPNYVSVGTQLHIPREPTPVIDVAAYMDPQLTGDNSVTVVNEVAENLTFLNIFQYAVRRDGTLSLVPEDQALINAAYEHRTMPLMVISNFEDGTFTTELATAFFTDEKLQDEILDQAINIMQEKGYMGIDFDFEYVGGENRSRYNQFLHKAKNRLSEHGYFLSTALAPKTSAEQIGTLYEGHDYAAQGKIVDFMFLMTYEWGWSGSPPMAVSPIEDVRAVLEFAISVAPADKIMMGIPLYGYDWTLPYEPGGEFARSISPQQTIETALRYNVSIQYDTTAQAPFFRYTDDDGKEHEVWFEDARSIQAKFDLVKELGIRGVFYWALGREFPQNWLLLQDNFIIRKRV